MKFNCCILIPAFEPENVLAQLVDDLFERKDAHSDISTQILIVNDGSTQDVSQKVLAAIQSDHPDVHLVNLSQNVGKGGALKAGLHYIERELSDVHWIVTADADGQHLPADIFKIVAAGQYDQDPVIGVREFDRSIPFRSYFGNVLTRKLFQWLHGVAVTDTQSGLRGFSRDMAKQLCGIAENRYSFELSGLVLFAKTKQLRQLPITTVYEPGNPTSHFDPLWDSLQIYFVLFRHILCTFCGMGLEIILFYSATQSGVGPGAALILARILAGSFLFILLRKYVFLVQDSFFVQIVKYAGLIAVNLVVAVPVLIGLLTWLTHQSIAALLMTYCIMFVINFIIQKTWIFRRS